jgi:ferrous iron transport protein B
MTADSVRRVALAGNPNSGKTSIFNALTGARQKVGNYPGVTVEKRQGRFCVGDEQYELLDLPGTYSLSSYSPEERIAQDELLHGTNDVVVLLADATNLKRGLVLLAQVLQTGANPVLCLNMSDEAARAGQKMDLPLLRQLLGFPVVTTVGHKGGGVDELRRAIARAAVAPAAGSRLVLGERLQHALDRIETALQDTNVAARIRRWVANRLLVDDDYFVQRVRDEGEQGIRALALAREERERIETDTGQDVALYVTERYYGFVDGLLREVVTRRARADARAVSDRIDSVVAHRVLGMPILLAVMYVIFWATFTLGEAPMGWIEAGFGWLGGWIGGLWPEASDSPLRSLLVSGVIGGVGGVLVFLPNILLLFLGLAVLEDTGYMARAAFVVDRVMHCFGLHGRSFIPMVSGFGCSVPAIMATRTMENERDRLATMLVIPLMSCGARLPIWMLLVPAFFAPSWRAPVLWSVYLIGIILALVLALILRKTLLRGEEAPFVMDLPPYRLPTVRAVVTKMLERSGVYLRKAGTLILGISIVMWLIASYPKADGYEVDRQVASGEIVVVEQDAKPQADPAAAGTSMAKESAPSAVPGAEVVTPEVIEERRAAEDLSESFAGRLGRGIEPVIRPLGLDWKVGVALLGAFAAKEVFVAQMGVIYSMGETDEQSTTLREAVAEAYGPIAGFALILFLLIGAPCMATLAVTRRESGSWKWALLQVGGLTAIGYVVALAFYQVAQLVV